RLRARLVVATVEEPGDRVRLEHEPRVVRLESRGARGEAGGEAPVPARDLVEIQAERRSGERGAGRIVHDVVVVGALEVARRRALRARDRAVAPLDPRAEREAGQLPAILREAVAQIDAPTERAVAQVQILSDLAVPLDRGADRSDRAPAV